MLAVASRSLGKSRLVLHVSLDGSAKVEDAMSGSDHDSRLCEALHGPGVDLEPFGQVRGTDRFRQRVVGFQDCSLQNDTDMAFFSPQICKTRALCLPALVFRPVRTRNIAWTLTSRCLGAMFLLVNSYPRIGYPQFPRALGLRDQAAELSHGERGSREVVQAVPTRTDHEFGD
jgi:hypothetical protein